MTTALMVITDGRDHIHRAIPSLLANVKADFTTKLIYDDSADLDNGDRLRDAFEPLGFTILCTSRRRGFGGAVGYAWHVLTHSVEEPWVFAAEDDFIYNHPVDLARLQLVLETNAELAQIVLKRQPWNPQEVAAGGIVEQHPAEYADRSDAFGNEWLEHRRFWSTNPALYRRSICAKGWPQVAHSEGHFGIRLVGEGYRFAFWGSRQSPPSVHHIGDQRVGLGY